MRYGWVRGQAGRLGREKEALHPARHSVHMKPWQAGQSPTAPSPASPLRFAPPRPPLHIAVVAGVAAVVAGRAVAVLPQHVLGNLCKGEWIEWMGRGQGMRSATYMREQVRVRALAQDM